MTYYSNSAYTAEQEVAENCHEVFTENSVDVRDFPPVEEYLQIENSHILWPPQEEIEPSLKTTKGEHKKDIFRIMNTHRYLYFPAMDNSTMTAFVVHSIKSIGYLGIFSFFMMIFFVVTESEPKAIYIYISSSRYNRSDYRKIIRNALCAKPGK